MASKASSPGPNPTTTTPAKQARSRKAEVPKTDVGRAGSAGGIILEKEKEAKGNSASKASKSTTNQDAPADPTSTSSKPTRRKPRKLNKDPTSAAQPSSNTNATTPIALPTAAELEALKSRVRGLEAKVEELYKTGALDQPGRSPRRRGKGRKASSAQQIPTLANNKAKVDDDVEEIGRGNAEEDAVEEDGEDELVRLEGELEVARQDLAALRPRNKRTSSHQTYVDDDVEDIPRDSPGVEGSSNSNRHVTLSGSYRIPLPAAVSVDDVKHIQSGVSAAQNVARSFLEQRRTAASLRETQNPPASPKPAASSSAQSKKSTKPRPSPKSVSSSMEVVPAEDAGGKQSWSEWIGGYSVAISRAVKNIEHEAAVESQRAGAGSASGGTKKTTGARKSAGATGTGTGKRPGVKTKLSGEQVDGLMS